MDQVSSMKIGYFVTDFPYKNPYSGEEINKSFYGGVGNVAYNLAVEMIKKGHKVFVFTSSIDSENNIEDYGELIIYRYKANFEIGNSPCSISLLYKPLLSNLNLDIVHIHAGNPPSTITGYLYSKKYEIPMITSYHGDVIWNFGDTIRKSCVYLYGKYCLTTILKSSTRIISPSSNYINESVILNKLREKITVIPNGINTNDFDVVLSAKECRMKLNLPLDRKIILYVGGLNPHKNPQLLLEIMPTILKEIQNALLVFVGDGILRKDLELSSIKLGIENNVMFVGFIKEELKYLYYKSSDIFCLTSLREPFGIVNLEAMASKIPIVASNCGGVLDFVLDGKNGFLASPQNANEFVKAILVLLKNDDLRISMGNTGKQMASNYSWTNIATSTERTYTEILNKDKHEA